MIRQPVENINVIGRNTQGDLKLDEGAKIATVTKVLKDEEDENTKSENEQESGEIEK